MDNHRANPDDWAIDFMGVYGVPIARFNKFHCFVGAAAMLLGTSLAQPAISQQMAFKQSVAVAAGDDRSVVPAECLRP